jgi:hypothetical protein
MLLSVVDTVDVVGCPAFWTISPTGPHALGNAASKKTINNIVPPPIMLGLLTFLRQSLDSTIVRNELIAVIRQQQKAQPVLPIGLSS